MNIDRFMARAVSENVVVQGREQHLRHLLECEVSGEEPHQSRTLPVDNQLTQPEEFYVGHATQPVLSAERPGLSEPIANPIPVQTPIATEPPIVTEPPVVYPLHPGLTREEWEKQQADKAVK